MKFVVCVPDGASDEPVEELGGRTPLEAARLPVLTALASSGEVGRALTIPDGFPPGSDVGNMSILGYDPARYHTGRAPIEAAALGIGMGDDQVAYRANLVTLGDDDTMVDFAGGHPPSDLAARAIGLLQAELGSEEVNFYPGVQYRHVVVVPASWADASCTPPHDLTGERAAWPMGAAAPKLQALMDAAREILAEKWPSQEPTAGAAAAPHREPGLQANAIWLWGQGRRPRLPPFRDQFGLEAGLVSAVDLVRGLAVLTGIAVAQVPGITGWYDTNYEGKREAALDALDAGADLFLIHVEASDEAGHAGDVAQKVQALENWDARIVGPLVEGLDQRFGAEGWRLLLLPDHATPLRLRTHTCDPVPFLIADSRRDGPGGGYSEAATSAIPPVAGHSLIRRLISG